MKTSSLMQLVYDREADVLYLSVGKPRPAVSREIGNEVLLQVEPDTGAVIGLTIFNLSTRSNLGKLVVQVDLCDVSQDWPSYSAGMRANAQIRSK